MKAHLIRHGATTTSGQTFAGRSDIPLNAEGKRMAYGLADLLSSRPIGLILSSPLSRAMDTARPLAQALGRPVVTDTRLMEFDFGDYEGRSKSEISLKLRKSHARVPVPGGEALIDVWNRAGSFLDDIGRHESGTGGEIAIVGHYWVNRMIFGRLNALDFDAACRTRSYRPDTGSAVTLKIVARYPESHERVCASE